MTFTYTNYKSYLNVAGVDTGISMWWTTTTPTGKCTPLVGVQTLPSTAKGTGSLPQISGSARKWPSMRMLHRVSGWVGIGGQRVTCSWMGHTSGNLVLVLLLAMLGLQVSVQDLLLLLAPWPPLLVHLPVERATVADDWWINDDHFNYY